MLRLGHGTNPATSARPALARPQARARRARGRRSRAGEARSRLRAHPRDLRPAALSAEAREFRHAPPHHSGAAALARYCQEALAASQAALPAADAAPLPRARRRHAHELRLHTAEDRLRPRPRARDPGAALLARAARASW